MRRTKNNFAPPKKLTLYISPHLTRPVFHVKETILARKHTSRAPDRSLYSAHSRPGKPKLFDESTTWKLQHSQQQQLRRLGVGGVGGAVGSNNSTARSVTGSVSFCALVKGRQLKHKGPY